jgi:MFS family permease
MSDVRIIVLVGVAHLTSHFLQLTLPPLFPLVKAEFGVPYVALGLLMSVFYGASGVGQTVSGFLVDQFGARRVLLTGMVLFAGGIALLAVAPTFWMMLPVAFVAGAGNSVFHPADYAIFNGLVSPRRVARAYSVHSICGNIGWILAPMVVVTVSSVAGWRAGLLTAAALALVVTLIVTLATRPLAAHGELRGRRRAQPLAADVRLLLSPSILSAFAYFMLLATSLIGIQTFSVTAMVAIYDTPIAVATGALTAFLLGNAGGILAGGVLADRTRRHDLVAGAGMLSAATLTLVVASAVVPGAGLAAVLAVAGFSLGVTGPSRDMLVRAATPQGGSGKVFGFVYSGLDLGALGAPLVYGWLLDHGEPRAMFVLVASLMLVAIVPVIQVRRHTVPLALRV